MDDMVRQGIEVLSKVTKPQQPEEFGSWLAGAGISQVTSMLPDDLGRRWLSEVFKFYDIQEPVESYLAGETKHSLWEEINEVMEDDLAIDVIQLAEGTLGDEILAALESAWTSDHDDQDTRLALEGEAHEETTA